MLTKLNLKQNYNKKHLNQCILQTVCFPFKIICVFSAGVSSLMTIDYKL